MSVTRQAAATATETLFRERYSEMVGLAGLLLDDRGAAEEVVQDAFAKYHLNRHRITDPEREVSYLRSIVCNLARCRAMWYLAKASWTTSSAAPLSFSSRPARPTISE